MRLILLSILFILSFSLQAQVIECGSAVKHQEMMESSELYRTSYKANNKRIKEIIDSGILDQSNKSLPPVYTIPVVVHVLYKTEGGSDVGNITDAQIISAINNMNDVFGGLIAPSPNVEIQFCLATQDPDCGATTGINRVDLTSFSNYAAVGITSANEETVKAQSFWPANQYYNIWTVTEIDDNDAGFGTQGYAYFPNLGSISVDGAVMLYNAIGYDPANNTPGFQLKSYTLTNETLTHEMGHALNLSHTFADGGNETTCASNVPGDCSTTGDFICDTEPHLNPASTCPVGATNTCTSATYGDVLYNFMNYSTTACDDRFTADQVTRMRATMVQNTYFDGMFVTTGRSSLSVSEGCSTPATTTSTTGYCSDETDSNRMGNHIGTSSVEIGSINTQTASPYFDSIYYFGSTHVTHCEFTSHEVGATVNVALDVEGFDGIGDNFVHAKIYIDYNNDGDFLDSNPDEEALLLNGTTSDNGLLAGSFTVPLKSAFPNLVVNVPLKMRVVSDFTGQTVGNLITPCNVEYGQMEDFNFMVTNVLPVELISYDAQWTGSLAELTWAAASETNNDYYEIMHSTDGINYRKITAVSSKPEGSYNYRYQYLHRSPAKGINYYKLSQFDLDGSSKNLGVRTLIAEDREIEIYPNPLGSSDELHVNLGTKIDSEWNLQVFDIQGRIVYDKNKSSQLGRISLDLSSLNSGSYYLRLGNETELHVENFVKY